MKPGGLVSTGPCRPFDYFVSRSHLTKLIGTTLSSEPSTAVGRIDRLLLSPWRAAASLLRLLLLARPRWVRRLHPHASSVTVCCSPAARCPLALFAGDHGQPPRRFFEKCLGAVLKEPETGKARIEPEELGRFELHTSRVGSGGGVATF